MLAATFRRRPTLIHGMPETEVHLAKVFQNRGGRLELLGEVDLATARHQLGLRYRFLIGLRSPRAPLQLPPESDMNIWGSPGRVIVQITEAEETSELRAGLYLSDVTLATLSRAEAANPSPKKLLQLDEPLDLGGRFTTIRTLCERGRVRGIRTGKSQIPLGGRIIIEWVTIEVETTPSSFEEFSVSKQDYESLGGKAAADP